MTPVSLGASLNPERVRLVNALLTRLVNIALPLDIGQEQPAMAKFAVEPYGSTQFSDDVLLELFINMNGIWRVRFSNLELLTLRPEFASWLEANPANKFRYLPKPLLRSVLERMFQAILSLLAQVTGFPVLFVGAPRNLERLSFAASADLRLDVAAPKPCTTILQVAWQDTATYLPIIELLESKPYLPFGNYLPPQANFKVHLELTRMNLSMAELKSLALGDVLLAKVDPTKVLVRLGSKIGFVGNLEGTTVTLAEQSTPNGETNMSETSEELAVESVQSLDLEIAFELPVLKIPLAECAKLNPGYTFTLAETIDKLPVAVVLGGKKVAIGRLVDVNGEVGVQLIQVAAQTSDGA